MAISRIALLPTVTEKESDKSVVDVAEEIKKIAINHGIIFLRIQLVIVLPIAALMMLCDFMFREFAITLLPFPAPDPLADTDNLITFGRLFPPAEMFRHILLSFQTSQVTLTVAVAIAVGWFNLFISLHYIVASVYAVVCFHNGKSPTFIEVLQVVPKLRSRVMVTSYWGYLFTFAASLPLLLYDIMSWARFPGWILLVLGIFVAAVSFVVSFYTSPVYQVANCIACCEERTGLGAFLKSVNLFDLKLLLKASFPVELFLRGLGSAASAVLGSGGAHMGAASHGFLVAAAMLLNSMITHLAIVCWTLVYIWIKEYHDESVDIVAFPEEQFRGPFQRVGTVKQGARVVGNAGLDDGD